MPSRLSRVQLFVTPWIRARTGLLCTWGFSRQEHWSGLPCPPSGDLPNPGIKPTSPAAPALQADSLRLSNWGSPPPLPPSEANSLFPNHKSCFWREGFFFFFFFVYNSHIIKFTCLKCPIQCVVYTVSSDRYNYAAKSLQSCPTLCYLRDGSPPGSPIPGILQARTLEWVAISFSNA